jgi:L-rhamnonate dehydratase
MRRRSFFATLAAAASPLPAFAQTPKHGPLKIADLEILKLEGHREDGKPAHAFYLKVKTDGGLDGLYGPIDPEAAIVVDQQLREVVRGQDPLAGEALWDLMYRSNRHSRHGHYMMAISAIDNACWDLRGRYFGVPVYRLLGGPTRDSVEAYGSCLGYSLEPEAARARALQLKQEGFRAQKWFPVEGPENGKEGMARNVELVKALREAVGDEYDLMFDAFLRWDLTYAISWAKQVEPYRPRWIEEAFRPDLIDSFAKLARVTTIPVAAGEHIYTRWEAHQYLKAGALGVLQCDPEWCGGISELVKICSLASLYDVPVIPHGHSLHAALHVVASQPYKTCPLAEYLIIKMSTYYHFEKNPPRLERARFALPQRPGFGIELDASRIEKQTEARWS